MSPPCSAAATAALCPRVALPLRPSPAPATQPVGRASFPRARRCRPLGRRPPSPAGPSSARASPAPYSVSIGGRVRRKKTWARRAPSSPRDPTRQPLRVDPTRATSVSGSVLERIRFPPVKTSFNSSSVENTLLCSENAFSEKTFSVFQPGTCLWSYFYTLFPNLPPLVSSRL